MELKLLIIDDEESIRAAMKDYFSVYGFEVDCAQEMHRVEYLLEDRCYDAAFVDLCLTGSEDKDGLQIIEVLRDRCPGTWIIALTALGAPSVEEEARKLGADLFLHKPQSLSMMRRLLQQLIGTRS
jgi:DNA-binding response OmpR family regulator